MGDHQEWESIYLSLRGPICGHIRKIVRNQAIAEELMQEVFFRLWLARCQLDDGRGSFKVWSLKIARNCALDYVRSAVQRHGAHGIGFERAESLRYCSSRTVETDYLHRGHLQAILSRATDLHSDQRTALQLAYRYGCSHSEIAARMNAPLGTVKSWSRWNSSHLSFSNGVPGG